MLNTLVKDFYPFEPTDVINLSLIPLRVRYKLDCAGVRLRLSQWQALTCEDKRQLLQSPVATPEEVSDYRSALSRLVGLQGDALHADQPSEDKEVWRNTSTWPDVVIAQCNAQQLAVPPLSQWKFMAETERHALFVLARSNHSQKEFIAAMTLFCKR